MPFCRKGSATCFCCNGAASRESLSLGVPLPALLAPRLPEQLRLPSAVSSCSSSSAATASGAKSWRRRNSATSSCLKIPCPSPRAALQCFGSLLFCSGHFPALERLGRRNSVPAVEGQGTWSFGGIQQVPAARAKLSCLGTHAKGRHGGAGPRGARCPEVGVSHLCQRVGFSSAAVAVEPRMFVRYAASLLPSWPRRASGTTRRR